MSGDSYGLKILKKFGYKEGGGVGPNNVVQESIKVKKKTDRSGLGKKSDPLGDSVWRESINEYQQILNRLSKSDKKSDVKLMKRKRTNSERDTTGNNQNESERTFGKFISSKKVSEFSKDELNCIFGIDEKVEQKSPQQEKNTKKNNKKVTRKIKNKNKKRRKNKKQPKEIENDLKKTNKKVKNEKNKMKKRKKKRKSKKKKNN
ncbi:pin2/terf1-interacting telomerase inhibitor [Anaeramoeba flamelloides]|uniref:Pin2/terf1-interacting telomerase inhibitor n=1 Tax=Anaeramoeba flamelloides TaxID=1746091 RepID=A0AAV8A6U2_9EUKA|nr:pin2/terf1-interacting telomerase inhibitor [Anaeramoeba flamelloides]